MRDYIDIQVGVRLGLVDQDGKFRKLDDIEKSVLIAAHKHFHGHITQMAAALGVGRSTLYRKFKEYGIDVSEQS